MAKIAFFGVPAYGHTSPTLLVINELIKRGHTVYYYSFNSFKTHIEDTNAQFISCDQYTDSRIFDNQNNSTAEGLLETLLDYAITLTDALFPDVNQKSPDIIVADSLAIWGKLLAIKLNIPFVSSNSTLAINPVLLKQSANLGFKQICKLLWLYPCFQRKLKKLQSYGFPGKSLKDLLLTDPQTETLIYTSKQFQPFIETFNQHFHFVGPMIRQVKNVIKINTHPLIYVSLGTIHNQMMKFYKNCLQALGDKNYTVIMSVGTSTNIQELGKIPRNITIYQQVDQISVLQQANVFITHAGLNSVSEGLYHEVPLLLYPQTSEQRVIAERVETLGAGQLMKSDSAKEIATKVSILLKDLNFKKAAQDVSAHFKKTGGAAFAADIILNCLK
ncbi:macrolide family glycosyltransferase [Exercitatus varius]|uniref:macrolide family glycosyltransferase n=1 Tax=Exercitatus varius TaxID=67857 RepID=UPI00294B9232|nr:macrolide family glycosyltransferase [Exercitatus varius]MDG2940905.1 glycosyltransferase [Exercitatus varius]